VRVEDVFANPQMMLRGFPHLDERRLPAAERFSFEAISGGRKPGEISNDSHYRSGAPDEWKEYALPALLDYVKTYLSRLASEFYPELVLDGCDLSRPFYELDAASRLAMTYSAIATGGTVLQRWKTLGGPEAEASNTRAMTAASMLAECGKIVDLGCGTMMLERYLPKTAGYVPVDLVARDSRTVVIDFNSASLNVGGEGGAMLGLLEYINDTKSLMAACRRSFQTLVVSYDCAGEGASKIERRSHAFVNDFSEADIEALFTSSGFAIAEKRQIDDSQILWKLI